MHRKELGDIKDSIRKRRIANVKKFENDFERESDDIKELIEEQKRRIQEIRKVQEQQQKMADDEEARFKKQMSILERELDRQTAIVREKQAIIDARKRQIQEEIDNQVRKLRKQFDIKLNEIIGNDDKRRDNLRQTLRPWVDRLQQQRKAVQELEEKNEETVKTTNDELIDTKATLAAKLVHDQLRFDHFLRDVEKRFEVFSGDTTLWGLSSDQVEEAERLVIRMERNVADSCPINTVTKALKKTVDVMKGFAAFLNSKGQKA